jgi:hypothetical protein
MDESKTENKKLKKIEEFIEKYRKIREDTSGKDTYLKSKTLLGNLKNFIKVALNDQSRLKEVQSIENLNSNYYSTKFRYYKAFRRKLEFYYFQ